MIFGAQMYSLRDKTQTLAGYEECFAKVKEMGYEAVQISGGMPCDPHFLAELSRKNGLLIPTTHSPFDRIVNDTDRLIEEHKIFGADEIGIGGMPTEFRETKEAVRSFIKKLEEPVRKMKAAGLHFGYHNHHFEFAHMEPHKPALELFYEKTCSKCVFSELDVHWVQRGGANPETWIRKLAGRIPVIHFKDFAMIELNPVFCEIGEGNLEWNKIIQACRDTGIRWYSIEQDAPYPGRDIFESMKISFNNLKAMGVK